MEEEDGDLCSVSSWDPDEEDEKEIMHFIISDKEKAYLRMELNKRNQLKQKGDRNLNGEDFWNEYGEEKEEWYEEEDCEREDS